MMSPTFACEIGDDGCCRGSADFPRDRLEFEYQIFSRRRVLADLIFSRRPVTPAFDKKLATAATLKAMLSMPTKPALTSLVAAAVVAIKPR